MNWAFALLGVSADTDIAAVKRAYARLLRTTRPDENAEAFQRLHAAYQLVLAHAKAHQADGSDTPASTFSPAPLAAEPPAAEQEDIAHAAPSIGTTTLTIRQNDPRSMARPPITAAETTPPANPQDLANRIIQHAVDTDDDTMLVRWLSAQPEFWSIQIKQQTGQLVLQQLFRVPQPMQPACLDMLLQFFDLQQVLSGVNPLALARLRQRQLALWYMLPENHRALAMRLNIPTEQSPNSDTAQTLLHQLSAPLRWQGMTSAFYRGRVAAIARLIHGLCGGQFDDLPASIDHRQAEFWYHAAQLTRPSWPRFIVGSVRAAFLALMVLLGVALICGLTSSTDTNGIGVLLISLTMAAATFSIWLVYAGWTWLDYWQRLPESAHPTKIWLCRALIPALCVISLVADYLLQSPIIAICVIAPTLVLMLRRYFHRNPTHSKLRMLFNRRGLFISLFVLGNVISHAAPKISDGIPLIAIIASITMGIWLADMWRHRHYLKNHATA